ncbi:MAG: hypothetical protein AAF432_15205 [Planctomycetota bacterium]
MTSDWSDIMPIQSSSLENRSQPIRRWVRPERHYQEAANDCTPSREVLLTINGILLVLFIIISAAHAAQEAFGPDVTSTLIQHEHEGDSRAQAFLYPFVMWMIAFIVLAAIAHAVLIPVSIVLGMVGEIPTVNRERHTIQRLKSRTCPKCKYRFGEIQSWRCPECGNDWAEEVLRLSTPLPPDADREQLTAES